MHELISTWKHFLQEHYGETIQSAPDYRALLSQVTMISNRIGKTTPSLLREYGRHVLINRLASCFQAVCSHDLLIAIREAHSRLRRTIDIPPIFQEKPIPNGLLLTYDGHEQLCSIIWGMLEGCALLFKENIAIAERSCIQQGSDQCLFEVHFLPPNNRKTHKHHQKIVDLLLAALPENEQWTLGEASMRLRKYLKYTIDFGILKTIITHHALIVASTNENQEWRVSKITSSIGDALVVKV